MGVAPVNTPAEVWRAVADEAAANAGYWSARVAALETELCGARAQLEDAERRHERFTALAQEWERGRLDSSGDWVIPANR
jgi:hypothetical protein